MDGAKLAEDFEWKSEYDEMLEEIATTDNVEYDYDRECRCHAQ